MRIRTITNWAYGITVILTALSAAAFIMSSRSAEDERRAVEEHLALDTLTEQLETGAEVSSDEARLYVMRGEQRHLDAFKAETESERQRETAAKQIAARDISVVERSILADIDRQAEALNAVETAAVDTFQKGDRQAAQQALFGPEHERLQTALLESAGHLRDITATRTGAALDDARRRSDQWSFVAKVMLAMTGLLFLAVLYFILRRRVAVPLVRMTGIVTRLARQDYAVEVPDDRRRDEIGEMNEAIQIFRENGLERERLDAERRADQHTKDLILQMMHRLQACENQQELAGVVARFAPQIFPGIAGSLYILNEDKSALAQVGTWLEPVNAQTAFPANACWGLRRGRPHMSGAGDSDVSCQHVEGSGVAASCLPLTAQGDMIGLLYLEERHGQTPVLDNARLYLELIAENVGLAVANLQFREKLTELAIRDPLTALFNRRFLDDTLHRRGRDNAQEQLACLMIDIDHFKRFNDQFGHDAGDMVMQHVGQVLRSAVAGIGSAFRFGGEEFTVLLPDCSEKDGFEFAEKVRAQIGGAALSHSGQIIGAVSVSIGVATSPAGGTVDTLVSRADAALLDAKATGRNKTVLASSLSRPPQETLHA